MTKIQNSKQYDLEDRTYRFAGDCRNLTKKIIKNTHNFEYIKQLVRSSGSQAANYIEANEFLSRKDFTHRVIICQKEVKESMLWLKLIEASDPDPLKEQKRLIRESVELRKIFGSILEKCK